MRSIDEMNPVNETAEDIRKMFDERQPVEKPEWPFVPAAFLGWDMPFIEWRKVYIPP